MTFVDFRKSFDSIHRGNMMRILKAYAIPPNLLRAIEQIYTNTKARVKSPDGEMGVFEITADVLQGDTLALFSIVIGLDYAMRKSLAGKEEDLGFTLTPRTSRRQTEGVLSGLDFVDDISQLSDRDRVISRTSSQSWEHLIFIMRIPTIFTGLPPNAAQAIRRQALRSGLIWTWRNVTCANNCSWGTVHDCVLLWERSLLFKKAWLPMYYKPFVDRSSEVV